MKFKRGEKVNVHFERRNGDIEQMRGKFDSRLDLGVSGTVYGVVRLSNACSITTPLQHIEKVRAI